MTTDRKIFYFTPCRGIMAEIEYPGVAQLVGRDIWECRGGIRDGSGRNAAKPCNTGNSGFSPVAENGTKAALTTGMTTDRKIFDFLPRRDIMAEK